MNNKFKNYVRVSGLISLNIMQFVRINNTDYFVTMCVCAFFNFKSVKNFKE